MDSVRRKQPGAITLLQPCSANEGSRCAHEAQQLFTGYRDELTVAHFTQDGAIGCLVQTMKDVFEKVHQVIPLSCVCCAASAFRLRASSTALSISSGNF